MKSFLFGGFKNTTIQILNLILTTSIFLYLISIYGFNHITKETITNVLFVMGGFTSVIFILIIALTIVMTISFKIAYNKIAEKIDNLKQ